MGNDRASILIVEDDEGIAGFLRRALTASGYGAAAAPSAEDGLEMAVSGKYDVVLADINLPGMGGLALLEKVKALLPGCDVIMMTGDPSMEKTLRAIKAGAYDFLIKPVSPETLLFVLERCLEKQSLSAEIRAIKSYRDELAAAYSQLKALDRMKEAFLSTIGHELRTPLTPIIGGLALMNASPGAPPPPGLLENMDKSAARLKGIIQELIDYARLGAEPSPADCAPVDMAEAAREAADAVRVEAAELGVKVEVSGARSAAVTGDRERLFQAVRHLVRNGVLFNKPGGLVRVEVSDRGGEVAVRVSDNGEGIPKERLDAVYEPFYQAADYLTRKVGGLGLGLALIKRAAESHRGRVEVASEPGRGSVFTLVLPKTGCR
jgi:signal transduction histidine kinase